MENIKQVNDVPVESDTLVFTPEQVKEMVAVPVLKLVGELNPILREVMPEYDFESQTYEERKAYVEAMKATMRGTGGIGLSSNQVNQRIRMFVMDQLIESPEGLRRGETLVCYNPKILEASEDVTPAREGCLTFPGLSVQVKRSNWIKVQFFDEEENEMVLDLKGLSARCFQHELDHMNGILFTSKIDPKLLSWERERQRKLVKKLTKQYGMFK